MKRTKILIELGSNKSKRKLLCVVRVAHRQLARASVDESTLNSTSLPAAPGGFRRRARCVCESAAAAAIKRSICFD